MTVIFQTLCGCTQYKDIPEEFYEYKLPLRTPISVLASTQPQFYATKARTFERTNQKSKEGFPIFLERYI